MALVTIEERMGQVRDALRERGHHVDEVVKDAIVDRDKFTEVVAGDGSYVQTGEGSDGKKDENPDTGPGSNPGVDVLIVDGHEFDENYFAQNLAAGPINVAGFVMAIEKALAEHRQEHDDAHGAEHGSPLA